MADTPVAQQDNALPAEGPWSASWDNIAKTAGTWADKATNALETATGVKMPWDVSGAELAAASGNKKPVDDSPSLPEQKPLLSFDNIFKKLVGTESNGQHYGPDGKLLTSSAGAQGVTQVMPKTGGDPGFGVTPIQNTSIDEYKRFGRDYLQAMLKNFGGNQEQAVAAYNAGPGRIQNAIAKANKTGGDWKVYIPSETRNYVRKILG